MSDFYVRSGVDWQKEDVHAVTKRRTTAALYPNAFCRIKQDFDQPNWARVTHSDGVGTKLSTAYLNYREHGDPTWFRRASQDSAAMNTDDMMCVGVTNNIAGTNSIDRNPYLVKRDALDEMFGGYNDFTAMLQKQGINIEMDSGETADLGDLVQTVTMNSSWFARLPKNKLITFDKVRPGNVIIALSSAGQATYEHMENSGIRSNGLTAARRLLLSKQYQEQYPEIVAPQAEEGYQGKYMIEDILPGTKMTVGDALTSPTRTYLPIVKYILDRHPGVINGLVHNSGGGLTKSMNYGHKLRYVKEDLMKTPAIFHALREAGKMEQKGMYSSFNMGHGLEIYAKPENAGKIIQIALLFGVEAQIIGQIEKSKDDKNHVTVIDSGDQHNYSK